MGGEEAEWLSGGRESRGTKLKDGDGPSRVKTGIEIEVRQGLKGLGYYEREV